MNLTYAKKDSRDLVDKLHQRKFVNSANLNLSETFLSDVFIVSLQKLLHKPLLLGLVKFLIKKKGRRLCQNKGGVPDRNLALFKRLCQLNLANVKTILKGYIAP